MPLKGSTLFYADVLIYLSQIFSPQEYEYRDDFDGDLIISKTNEIMYVIEIKSEVECATVTRTPGKTFKDLREKINSLKIFEKHGEGKYQGWLTFIAQPYDYFKSENLPTGIKRNTFKNVEIALAIPNDKLKGCEEALTKVSEGYNLPKPVYRKLRKKEFNIAILFFEFQTLDQFFKNIEKIRDNGEQSGMPER
jgi:hypothetical protein